MYKMTQSRTAVTLKLNTDKTTDELQEKLFSNSGMEVGRFAYGSSLREVTIIETKVTRITSERPIIKKNTDNGIIHECDARYEYVG